MNVNVTKIERLSNGIIQFYNGSEVVDSFSITSSVSVLFESNVAKSISFISNVKTLSFNVYNVLSVYGATSNKIYSSGIDPSDTSSAYISRLYDIYAFLISDVIQGCCPGPTFVGGVVATYPDFASFPVTGQESVIYIDESTSTAYFWNGSNYEQLISLSVADKMVTIGRNSTGSTLYKGIVIYISGSTGNRPNFVKAQANSEATSAGTFGVILDDIPNNSDGYVVTIGTIDNLDTRSTAPNPFTSDTLVDGDTIYLSPTTAGYVTNVKPYAPDHLVYVGKVVRTSPTDGTIVYRIQNGYELDELHNVSITSPTDNQALVYESATSLWKNETIDKTFVGLGNVDNTSDLNKPISTATQTALNAKQDTLGYTPVPETRTLTINGTTQDLSANRTFTIATGLTIGSTAIASGTVGRVLFEGTGNVLQQSGSLFWDNTNSRLGIGTATPTSRLDIIGTFDALPVRILRQATYGEILRIGRNGVSETASINYPADGVFAINTAASERMRVNASGNVLIGTTTDNGARLQVKSSAINTDVISILNTSNVSLFRVFNGGSGQAIVDIGGTVFLRSDAALSYINSGNFAIGTTIDSGYKLDVNGTARVSGSVTFGSSTGLFWDNTNNRLGIGTNAPTLILDVRSAAGVTADARLYSDTNQFFTLSLSTASLNGIRLYNNTNPFALGNDAGIQASNKRLSLGTVSANDLCLGTNAACRVLINGTTGNVLIGTTTDVASSILTLASTTKGFLPPRMTNAQRLAIASPAVGLIVYCTDAVEGLYVNKSTGWTFVI